MHLLYATIRRLKEAKLYFSLDTYRGDAVTISVTVPGERIEIEIFADESVEIARFRGSELDSTDPSLIDEIIETFKD